MKYLILLIISLFCLTSYSDHKKDIVVSKEEKARYENLLDKALWQPLTDKEQKEFDRLGRLIYRKVRLHEHFNDYMFFEHSMNEALKGDLNYQFELFNRIKAYRLSSYENINEKIPNCTKERLTKGKCPQPPYTVIYWAKKNLESGYCVWMNSFALNFLMDGYVIPKTNTGDSEAFFHMLNYLSYYFFHQYREYDYLKYMRKLSKKTKTELEKKAKNDPHFKFDSKKEACLQSEFCLSRKKQMEERIRLSKNKKDTLRKKLNEKQIKTADKMISDFIKKWSKKYGKNNVYQCREYNNEDLMKKTIKDREEFLDKHYPYLD